MNSKNILRLLAILLIFVNIILLLMVASVYKQKYYINESYIENTYNIFREEGIGIVDGAIPDEKLAGYIYSAAVDEDYYETVAENLTDETISTRFMIPGGYALTTETGKSLEFSEDYYFKYSVSHDVEAELSTEVEEVSLKTKNKLLDTAESFLSAADEGNYPSEFTLGEVFYDRSSGLYHIALYQTVNEIRLFSHELKLIVDIENTVLFAEGNWCFHNESERYTSQIYDQVNILFIDKANRTENDTAEISKVTPYYIIYTNDETSSVLLVPAWCIEYNDNTFKIYDAENGDLTDITK